jgi:citrate synthase
LIHESRLIDVDLDPSVYVDEVNHTKAGRTTQGEQDMRDETKDTRETRDAERGTGAAQGEELQTRLSLVDGARGRLVIAGEDVEALAGRPFEAVCARLWERPVSAEALGAARAEVFAALVPLWPHVDGRPDAMATVRGLVGTLRAGDEEATDPATALRLVAAVAVASGLWAQRRRGVDPVAPDPALGHAADYLRLMTGRVAEEGEAAALDRYFATVVDHGLNASTYAARVVTSTGSDPVSAVTAALGALKGPLHGGAPGPVLDMLDGVGSAEAAPGWVRAELAAGRRIMGMGHRVYRVRDPRAEVLEGALALLPRSEARTERVRLARAVEEAARSALAERYPERSLCANVEFYTALLLEALGLDRAAFSVTFAASRVAGWVAHIAEQRTTGRLIRPLGRYTGPLPASPPRDSSRPAAVSM